MKKKEIIDELCELQALMSMHPETWAKIQNEKYAKRGWKDTVTSNDYYTFVHGYVSGALKDILQDCGVKM